MSARLLRTGEGPGEDVDHTALAVPDCTSSSTDRNTSRAAPRLRRSVLSPLFLLCSCFAVLNVCVEWCVCVCVCVCVCSWAHLLPVFSSAAGPCGQRESNRRLHRTSPVTQPLGQHPPQRNIGDMHVQHIRVPGMSLWPWRLLTGQDRYEGTAHTSEQHTVLRDLGTHYACSHPICVCVWSPGSCLPYALSLECCHWY